MDTTVLTNPQTLFELHWFSQECSFSDRGSHTALVVMFLSLCQSVTVPQYFFLSFFLFNKFIYLFLAALGLRCCVQAFSSCGERGYSSSWCVGFSVQWLLLLHSTGSRCTGFSSCGLRARERRLSSCGAQAQLLHGMWDLPGPGLEPVSPALAGGFLITAPPGKS